MLELDFVLDSEKKHSVRYKHEESGMVVYVPKDLLTKIYPVKGSSYPKALKITFNAEE